MDDNERSIYDNNARPMTSASVVASICAFAVARGLAIEDILAITGLKLEQLIEREGRLPHRHISTVWHLLRAKFPGVPVALEMASFAPDVFFGPLGSAIKYASTLREAVQLMCRYQMILSSGLDVCIIDGHQHHVIRVKHTMDAEEFGFGAEAGMALTWRSVKELVEDTSLIRVDFSHGPNGPVERYVEVFQAPVRFGQSANAFICSSETFSAKLPARQVGEFHLLQQYLSDVRRRLPESSHGDGLGPIRDAVALNAKACDYSADALAGRLGIGLRTLQRRIKPQGVTVRQLIEEVRQANAKLLLCDESLSIDDVAFLLGYSSDGAFRRACARWTGMSPTQLRCSLTLH